jgi:hypothetical protein
MKGVPFLRTESGAGPLKPTENSATGRPSAVTGNPLALKDAAEGSSGELLAHAPARLARHTGVRVKKCAARIHPSISVSNHPPAPVTELLAISNLNATDGI